MDKRHSKTIHRKYTRSTSGQIEPSEQEIESYKLKEMKRGQLAGVTGYTSVKRAATQTGINVGRRAKQGYRNIFFKKNTATRRFASHPLTKPIPEVVGRTGKFLEVDRTETYQKYQPKVANAKSKLKLFGTNAKKETMSTLAEETYPGRAISWGRRQVGKGKTRFGNAVTKQEKKVIQEEAVQKANKNVQTGMGAVEQQKSWLGSKINPVLKQATKAIGGGKGYESTTELYAKQKARGQYAKEHPYTATFKAGKMLGTRMAGASTKVANRAGRAIGTVNNAAEMVFQKYKVLAMFKPLFWSLKITSIGLTKPMPFIYAGLILGLGLMIWLYGAISGYYALYFLKCIPALFANAILSIFNAIWFGIHGIFNFFTAAIVTIINQVEYYFLQPFYGVSSYVGVPFKGIPINITLQPDHAFAYFVPTPLNVAGGPIALLASLGSYDMVMPGANPYLYNYTTDQQMFDVQFEQNGGELRFPAFNFYAKADGFWCSLKDQPPPLDYRFPDNIAGYQFVKTDTDIYSNNGTWELRTGRDISLSIVFGIASVVSSAPITPDGWLRQTGWYSATGYSEQRPRGEMMTLTALGIYLKTLSPSHELFKNVDTGLQRWSMRNYDDPTDGPWPWNKGPKVDHNGIHPPYLYIENTFSTADIERFNAMQAIPGNEQSIRCWLNFYLDAMTLVRTRLGNTYNLSSDEFRNNVPWDAVYQHYYEYFDSINIDSWWLLDGNDVRAWKCNIASHGGDGEWTY